MNLLDLRTVVISSVFIHALCAWMIFHLWRRHRGRSPELAFWLIGHGLQCAAALLIALRGTIPDSLSIPFGAPLILGGTLLLLIGLQRYLGQPRPPRWNIALLTGFSLIHLWFTFATPNLQARSINFSVGLLVLTVQCAGLLLRPLDAALRPATRMAGWVFCLFALASGVRVIADLAVPPGDDFFASGLYDTLVILTYQVLFIALTFALFLMVNYRLFADLERDIAERRRAEAALSESEARFRALTEESLVGVWVVRDGRFQYANAATAAIAGRTPGELVRLPSYLDLVAEVDRPRVAELVRRKTAGEADTLHYEAIVLRPDGTRRQVEVLATVIRLGGQSVLLGTMQDVTARKEAEVRTQTAQRETARLLEEARASRRALLGVIEDEKETEAALRQSEARFRTVVEEAPEAIFIQTRQRFAYVNAAALRLFGARRPEDLLGQPILDRFHPDFRAQVTERIRTLNEQRLAVPAVDEVCLTLDGAPCDVNISAVPFTYENEHGALVFARNITERKRAERKLAEQLRELQRWHEATLGREGRILELKRQVNELLEQAGQPIRYPSAAATPGNPPPPEPPNPP